MAYGEKICKIRKKISGNVQTLTQFIKVCLDEDLFRYSSVIRAFGTWTGLGYDNEKPAVVKKAGEIAYTCLINEEERGKYLESQNNLEAYLALWAMGCYEIADTNKYVEKLLQDVKKYRRILGWLFISHADNQNYQMKIAKRHLKLGDKRFQILYKSAKYITTGNSRHRRSQLYTDAVLGRLDAEALKAEIIGKRNQEKLRCYPLIPLAGNQ